MFCRNTQYSLLHTIMHFFSLFFFYNESFSPSCSSSLESLYKTHTVHVSACAYLYMHTGTCIQSWTHNTHICTHSHMNPSPTEAAQGRERIKKHSRVCPLWPVAVGRRGCLSPLISPGPQEAHLHTATDPSVPHG